MAVGHGAGSWCRRNSWCCNRISDYIKSVVQPVTSEGFHLKDVVKQFRSIQYASAGCRQAQCGIFCHVTVGRGDCSPQEQAVGTAPALPLFIWDETCICLVLPFFAVEGKKRGKYEEQCVVQC